MKIYLTITISQILVLLLTSQILAYNLIPCDYIYKDFQNIKASEEIFDSLLYSASNISLINSSALLKHTPAFEPEIVFILYPTKFGFSIRRVIASDNIFGLIQEVAHNNEIEIPELSQNKEKLISLLNPIVKWQQDEKIISKKLGSHILGIFYEETANSKTPTEAERKEIFSGMDGPVFYFKSKPSTCSIGVAGRNPAGKNLVEIVHLLTEMFAANSKDSVNIQNKILTIGNKKENF